MMLRDDRIYMAFHKGGRKGISDKAMSGIIKLFTSKDFRDGKKLGINKNQYSHTEIIFPKNIAGEQNSFSSRGSSKPSGVHFKKIDYSHPDRWDIIEIKWIKTEKEIKDAYEIAKSYEGAKYAYNNVLNTFGFVRTRKDRKGDKDWWCSEICCLVISIPDYKLSPNKAFTVVCQRNINFTAGEAMNG